jgi:hypothetical protein
MRTNMSLDAKLVEDEIRIRTKRILPFLTENSPGARKKNFR